MIPTVAKTNPVRRARQVRKAHKVPLVRVAGRWDRKALLAPREPTAHKDSWDPRDPRDQRAGLDPLVQEDPLDRLDPWDPLDRLDPRARLDPQDPLDRRARP